MYYRTDSADLEKLIVLNYCLDASLPIAKGYQMGLLEVYIRGHNTLGYHRAQSGWDCYCIDHGVAHEVLAATYAPVLLIDDRECVPSHLKPSIVVTQVNDQPPLGNALVHLVNPRLHLLQPIDSSDCIPQKLHSLRASSSGILLKP
jgi:hypothetical protein